MTNKAFGNKADYTEITGREANDLFMYMVEDDAQVFYMEQDGTLAIVAPNCDDPTEIVCELFEDGGFIGAGFAETFEDAVKEALIDVFATEALLTPLTRDCPEDVVNHAAYYSYFAFVGGEPEDSFDFDFQFIDEQMGRAKAYLIARHRFTEEDLDY